MPRPDALSDFAASALRPGLEVPPGLIAVNGRVERRFAVYRNNIAVGLIEAIGARYPLFRRAIGEDDFRPLARAYVAAEKPRTPVLSGYGSGFPRFLDGSGQVPGRLVDLARIENAYVEAYHSAEAELLGLEALGSVAAEDLGRLRLRFHPSVRLVAAATPAASLWASLQPDGVRCQSTAAETALILRPVADVSVTILPARDAAFVGSLLAGQTLEEAAEGALDQPDFDFGTALVGLFSLGAITALNPTP